MVVLILGIVTDIDGFNRDQSLFHRPANDTGVQSIHDHFRK